MRGIIIVIMGLLSLSATAQRDTTDRGAFIEAGISRQDGGYVGIGVYEKVDFGKRMWAMMDYRVAVKGEELNSRLRFGIGVKYKKLRLIAYMPQLNQRNFGEYNTPFGFDIFEDREHIITCLGIDFYKDATVLTLKVRFQ